MAVTATTFGCHRAIVLKAHCPLHPQQKRDPVEYQGIPPELWLRIFSFLRADLSGLTMVSKSFAALAQPLLFQHIAVRPACGQHSTSGRLTCRRNSLERITERIQFSTQERIAHAVDTIEFSPTITYAIPESSSAEVTVVADMVVPVHAFAPTAATLAHHLRSFHAANCHFSDQFYDHGRESLVEEFAMVWQGNTADLLGVTLSRSSHQRWFEFTHLDHLRTLNLAPLDAFLNQMLADIVDRGIKLHALRSLGLPWMAIQSESLVPLLERSPFLHELRFTVRPSHRTITTTHPLPRHVLRNLSLLEAPDHVLPLLLESRSIRGLSCATVRDGSSLPTDIIAVFDALPSGAFWGLEKLSLDIKCLSDELLDCLMRIAPHLTTLSVDIRGMAWGPTPGSLQSHTIGSTVELFLSLQLPSTLEYLYIGKQYATVIRPAVRQLNGDDVLVLKSHFSLNYPSLKEAHFYAVNFIMKYEKGNVTTITLNACRTLGDAFSHHSIILYP